MIHCGAILSSTSWMRKRRVEVRLNATRSLEMHIVTFHSTGCFRIRSVSPASPQATISLPPSFPLSLLPSPPSLRLHVITTKTRLGRRETVAPNRERPELEPVLHYGR